MKKEELSAYFACVYSLLSQREGHRLNEEDEEKTVYQNICVFERQLKTKVFADVCV